MKTFFLHRYGEMAKKISRRYRDQPMRPLETAIYWVEYIARHKGAAHMHSAGQDLSFLAYHNLDILLAVLAFFYILTKLVKKCCKTSKTSADDAVGQKKFN